MKLTYILPGKFFASEEGRGGQVAHALGVIKGLAQNNLSVTVVGEPNLQNKYVKNTIDGVTFESINKDSFPIPIVSKLKFAYKCTKKATVGRRDAVLIRKNIYILLICFFTLGFKLSKVRQPVYWEVNGLSLQNLLKYPVIRYIYYFILFIHKIILRQSDGVYVVSKSLKEELSSGFFAVDSKKVRVIPNGAPPWLGPKYLEGQPFRFIFFGVFQPYNDFTGIIEAFKRLKNEVDNQIELHFCGYGKQQDIIKEETVNAKDIYYWGPMIPNDLHYENIATFKSVGLIPLKNITNSKFLSPVKLFDYAALGMPVIVSSATNIDHYPAIEGVIYEYEAENMSSLVKVMKDIMHDEELWSEISFLTEKATKRNSWKERMALFKEMINRSK
jgi:glycosyltransferase involved in cell wall biosynthesis